MIDPFAGLPVAAVSESRFLFEAGLIMVLAAAAPLIAPRYPTKGPETPGLWYVLGRPRYLTKALHLEGLCISRPVSPKSTSAG